MIHEFRTGSTAISESFTGRGGRFQIVEVRLHLSAAGGTSEDFTVTLNSGAGSDHDALHHAQDMNAVANDVWRPERPAAFLAGDAIDFAYTNTNSRTWGLEIVWKEV